MLSTIQAGLGYDEMGNAPHLMTDADRRNLDLGRIQRVNGDDACPGCGEPYRLHPQVQGALWARRGCYSLVKL